MAIRKENKFDNAVAELNEQETIAEEKSRKVMKTISGGNKTKTIIDKNGRERIVKVAEKRKTFTTAYGKSNNSAIVELIRDYVTQKKSVLDEV